MNGAFLKFLQGDKSAVGVASKASKRDRLDKYTYRLIDSYVLNQQQALCRGSGCENALIDLESLRTMTGINTGRIELDTGPESK